VGPGGGALTKYLVELPVIFKAAELDDEKTAYLKNTSVLNDHIIGQSFKRSTNL
jgi:16S rRNA (adenine1518-N6/adenine1519-N6)-dimethyltransferase